MHTDPVSLMEAGLSTASYHIPKFLPSLGLPLHGHPSSAHVCLVRPGFSPIFQEGFLHLSLQKPSLYGLKVSENFLATIEMPFIFIYYFFFYSYVHTNVWVISP
jgi:hypothetical protein